jgi:hypothetical protein
MWIDAANSNEHGIGTHCGTDWDYCGVDAAAQKEVVQALPCSQPSGFLQDVQTERKACKPTDHANGKGEA